MVGGAGRWRTAQAAVRRPVVVGAGLLLAGTLSAAAGPAPQVVARSSATSATGSAAGTWLAQAVPDLLARRSAAVLRQDRDGWRATVDGSALSVAEQLSQFDRIRALPVTRWRYTPAGAVTSAAGGAARVRVTLTYRLAGDTRDVVRSRILTLDRARQPRVVSEVAAAATDRDLWDLDAVTVLRTGSGAVVVGLGEASPQTSTLAARLDTAVRAVDAAWGPSWPRAAVLVVPADESQFAALLGRPDGAVAPQLAAVTTGRLDRGRRGPHAVPGAADRVLLNPAVWPRLTGPGLQAVLVHELTHVATRAGTGATPATWLEEGFATYLGYRAAGLSDGAAAPGASAADDAVAGGRQSMGAAVPDAELAADALTAVRAGRLPATLPADDAFDAAGPGAAAAYAQAWVACDLIADRAGVRGLVALYRAAASGAGAATATDAALRQVLGEDTEAFTTRWRARLAALAVDGR